MMAIFQIYTQIVSNGIMKLKRIIGKKVSHILLTLLQHGVLPVKLMTK